MIFLTDTQASKERFDFRSAGTLNFSRMSRSFAVLRRLRAFTDAAPSGKFECGQGSIVGANGII